MTDRQSQLRGGAREALGERPEAGPRFLRRAATGCALPRLPRAHLLRAGRWLIAVGGPGVANRGGRRVLYRPRRDRRPERPRRGRRLGRLLPARGPRA